MLSDKNNDPGRNNNEEQTDPARVRRHRACRHRRLRAARALRLGRREEIRSGRQRYRNQARTDRAAQRPRLALRRARPGRRSLFPDAERKGRHQRPQGEILHHGRRLQRAEMRRGDAAAGRAGRSAGAVRLARHRAADRRAQISQLQGRAAAAAQHRRVEMERSEELQMDHGGPAAVSDRGAHSRQACRCARSRTPRSASSTRTTISAAISSARSRRCWRMPAAPPR